MESYKNIPDELKRERRFVCFDIGKKPMNSITGGYASSTDKNTWSSFEEAIEGVKKHGYAGIGFVLGDGFFGVDLDTASTPGLDIISPEATEIIGLMDSYTERSISGYGFHIIGKQSGIELPFNKIEITPNGIIREDIDPYTKKQKLNPDGSLKFKKPELEVYTEGRYFTLTGDIFGKTKSINGRSDELKKLVEKYKDFVKLNVTPRVPNNNVKPIKTIEEALLLDKVLNDYWNGKRPSGDESRDDMGFLSKLLYWCDANVDVAIEAFMESPYAAQKDEQHSTKIERVDYLLRTANKAMPITTAAIENERWLKASKQSKKDYAIKKRTKSTEEFQVLLKELQPYNLYPRNDKGNGELFADIFVDVARFNVTANEWFVFDGRVWLRDVGAMRVSRMAKRLMDELLVYSTTIEDESRKADYQKHIARLGNRSERETMVKDARDKYHISNTDIDKEADLFNCQNGTLNLKTFEFREHRAEDLLSKIANAHYDPDVVSKIWEESIMIMMMGDAQKANYLQKAIGYGLTADTSVETCFILYGPRTRNGKSTVVETVMHTLGGSDGYAMQMKPESLAQKQNTDSRQASGDIARIAGTRFLNVSEPQKKMIFDAALLKTLIGRDSIVARHLHEREFEFMPVFKLFMNTNYLPIIQDDTLFASGRINVIKFEKHFSETDQDQQLKNKLRSHYNISGVLNWCLSGLRKFYDEGIKPPKSVVDATKEYRQESDKVGRFLEDCLETSSKNMTAALAYRIYEGWCRACGYGVENQGNFFAELKSKNLLNKTGTVEGKTRTNVLRSLQVKEEWKNLIPFGEF